MITASVQQLVDCTWDNYNGCNGGWVQTGNFIFVKKSSWNIQWNNVMIS
jgi:hypothetical protein